MTIEEQIAHLNNTVKCTLKPSPIHGIGVFALRDIKKREELNCVAESGQVFEIPLGRLQDIRPEILSLILDRWPQAQIGDSPNGSPFYSPNSDVNLMSFMNHSSTPNSQFGIAVKDIKAGEEITEDYDTGNLSEIQKQHYNFI
jgi:SET domain-containing protein